MIDAIIKIGGSILTGPHDAGRISALVSRGGPRAVFVVSAFKGVTDAILDFTARATPRIAETRSVEAFAEGLAGQALAFARALSPVGEAGPEIVAAIDAEKAAFARCCLEDAEDRIERAASFGERFASLAVLAAADDLRRALPEDIALVAEGESRREAEAAVDWRAGAALEAMLDSGCRPVVPGFYGVDRRGLVALFGRGGSDYSAAALARSARARVCELVKDGAAIRSADPFLVDGTRKVSRVSYKEARALARAGARVLHPRAAALLANAGIPLHVRADDFSECTRVDGAAAAGLKAIVFSPRPRARAGESTLSLVGEGVERARSSAARAFAALRKARIEPRSVSCPPGGAALSIWVRAERGHDALRVLHGEFFGSRRTAWNA